MTPRETAKLYGVTAEYVSQLMRQKRIGGYQPDGVHWEVDEVSAARFFTSDRGRKPGRKRAPAQPAAAKPQAEPEPPPFKFSLDLSATEDDEEEE